YGQVALTGEPVRFTNEAKGLGRWFDVYAFRLGDPGDRRVALLFTDVTAHKDAKDAVTDSERRYRTLVGQIKEYAIFSTDPQGRATTWGEGVEHILGYSEAEFIGNDVTRSIFLPEDIERGVPEQEFED